MIQIKNSYTGNMILELQLKDLVGANLRDANLCDADLYDANLRGANLYGADLRGADGIYLACPEVGAFTAFKKCHGGLIVELLIPADAKRSSATGRKCRCDKAVVVGITNTDGSETAVTEAPSKYNLNFTYRIGETVSVDNFEDNRFIECAPGIHFFITRQEAVEY